MSFEIRKDNTKWAICATGSGWELIPAVTNQILFCLNDYILVEKYKIKPDLLCFMDILDEKPQIVSGVNNLGDVIHRINSLKVPLIGPMKYEEIPLSESFPLEECVKEFGLPYFTNTICYMIAFALLSGAKELNIYGVNQAGSHEYAEEKGGVEYWIGIANGRGVKTTIHGAQSQLLKFKGRYGREMLYGYLDNYKNIVDSKNKFGEPVVKKLIGPIKPVSRLVRKVNYDS